MGRTLPTIALLIGSLALGATAAHAAGSDPHAKKPAADTHAPKKTAAPAAHPVKADAPAAKADAHPAKADAHAAKAEAHAPKADAHAAKPDAHVVAKAPAAHAAKPSHTAVAAGHAAAGKPLATDLHALSNRIQERVVEVRKAQQAATTAKPRQQGTSGHGAEQSVERVRVVWKITVAWPEELQPRDEATNSGERVSVSWSGMAP